jgi:DNA/RNA-binding domain of Phe-tRNA-synthetase-like protein
LDVSKAFYDAGLPFTSLITGNQYVTGQVPFLPFALNKGNLRYDVQAQLSGSNTTDHTGEVVWVFDTDAHAQQALKAVPLKQWGQGPQHIVREQFGNVIVVASGFTGAPKAKLDQALSAL